MKYMNWLFKASLNNSYLLIFVIILISIFWNNTVFAEENTAVNYLYDLPEVFFQEEWVDSEDNVVIYLLNFHELDNKVIESTTLEGYFSDEAHADSQWQYLEQEALIEFRNIFGGSNSISIESVGSLIDRERNYTSWLMVYPENTGEISLREQYVGMDRIRRAEDDRLLEISLNPRKVSYQRQRIFTEFSFHYGSSSEENSYQTALWLDNTGLETLAVVSRKFQYPDGFERRYYAIQLAAAAVSSESLSRIEGNFLAVGNLTELNEMFDDVDIANTDRIKNNYNNINLTLGIGNQAEYLALNHIRSSNLYKIELSRLSEYDELSYLIDADLSLLEKEGLFLSLRISNLENIFSSDQDQNTFDGSYRIYSPILRSGIGDRVNWSKNLQLGLAYYPLYFNTLSGEGSFNNRVWQLIADYDYQDWKLAYQGSFIEGDDSHQIELEYHLEENIDINLIYGLNCDDQSFFSLAYSFPI
ncbi:MAG: hypothetical protein ACLFPF_08680 [Halanaerobiales bacterium]